MAGCCCSVFQCPAQPAPPVAAPPFPPVPPAAPVSVFHWSPSTKIALLVTVGAPPGLAPPAPAAPAAPPVPPVGVGVAAVPVPVAPVIIDRTVRAGSSSTCCPSISTKLSDSDIKSS
ncbi:MAG: hypothetical protein DLM60_03925 [Pseudonocardiales bacterium]|nr:MAG: hypothetical protein DLM60_03925 [Pseudonocardiales bacterium]